MIGMKLSLSDIQSCHRFGMKLSYLFLIYRHVTGLV